MIFVGLGANLPHSRHGAPRATLEAALAALESAGVAVAARSRWYRSPPWPAAAEAAGQPWYVNAVARLETDLEPAPLLALLHRIEQDFGRTRRARNEARVLDLDLLAYGSRVSEPDEVPALPHPRLAERDFVLLPLAEIAPGWRHPVSGLTVEALIARLPAAAARAEPLEPEAPA